MASLLVFAALLPVAAMAQATAEWSVWSARQELRPDVAREGEWPVIGGGGRPEACGGWIRRIEGVRGGAWQRFSPEYQAHGVAAENWQVVACIDWIDAAGRRAGQPEYAAWSGKQAETTRLWVDAPAPPDRGCGQNRTAAGKCRIGRGALAQRAAGGNPPSRSPADPDRRGEPAPGAHAIRPGERGRVSARDRGAVARARRPDSAPPGDHGCRHRNELHGRGGDRAGPTTARLAELALARKTRVAAGIYERDGRAVYKAAVLIDREGRVAGRYRKVSLPGEEVEGGLTPGSSWPVFETDFGRVGMMSCYDVLFPEPARALAAQGAELILLPIWGGDETLAAARAIENRVFLAA